MQGISKKDLLERLHTALVVEERVIPIYSRHLKSAVFWTGIEEGKACKVKEVFQRLASESTEHKKIVEKMIRMVEQARRDAY